MEIPPSNRRSRRGKSRRGSREERRKSRRGKGGLFRALLPIGAGLAAVLAVVVLVAVIGSYTFLPGMVSERIATGVREDFGLDRDPEVEVRSDPPPNILRGKFSEGDIAIGAGEFWGFNVEGVNVALDPFDVDVPASLSQRTLIYEEPSSGTLEAVVSSEEVGRVAREESGIDDVRLESGRLVVEQDPQLFGSLTLPIEVRGRLGLRGNDVLVYTPEQVDVVGVSLPQETTESILSGVELTFPIEDVANGVTLREANIAGNELILTGDVDGIR
ncbi:MAG: LmeA family phospholipid-binding protein [Rubrobacter sp.]